MKKGRANLSEYTIGKSPQGLNIRGTHPLQPGKRRHCLGGKATRGVWESGKVFRNLDPLTSASPSFQLFKNRAFRQSYVRIGRDLKFPVFPQSSFPILGITSRESRRLFLAKGRKNFAAGRRNLLLFTAAEKSA
ncbi:Hypothetical protein NTJ_07779 [Nesidiocoris tenuis]|uniref:Uncharacterized protein n=1 Tax=Nesidiocoris tenuis TaxID=355587 RepID=A0ABN7ARY4_9HEMI|nr:Hypothetical protein NTJ_07779 [Nesidiocoris tenuis]